MRKTAGISLILLIFLSLCLIIFSLLSLSGATADEKLSIQAADRTTEYYEAVSAANEVITDIDLLLAEYLSDVLKTAGTKTDHTAEAIWLELCTQIPEHISFEEHPKLVDMTLLNSTSSLQFDIAVTEDQLLHVVLQLHYPTMDADTMYTIAEWKIVNTQEWEADRSMNLFRTDSDLFAPD